MDELREKLAAILSDYFHIGDSYHYTLGRDKEAFGMGTMSLDDFTEYGEETIAELVDHLLANGVTVQQWIPVTERLPDKEFWEHQKRFEDEDLEVQVMIKGALRPTTLLYNAEGEFYEQHSDGQTFYLVTHWAPLMDPPKEVE